MLKKIMLLVMSLLVISFIVSANEENTMNNDFLTYVKSEDIKNDYIGIGLGQMYQVMEQRGKTFDNSISDEEINQKISDVLGANFDQIKLSVRSSKLNKKGELELIVDIEGKDIMTPLETNVISSTSQRIMNAEKFSRDFMRYMRMYPAGKKRVKVIYTLVDDEWVLTEDNETKLLGALLLIKNFND